MVERKITHEAHCSGNHIIRRDGSEECLLGDQNIAHFDIRAPFALAALRELEAAVHSTTYYGSTNVKATIAESILASAKATFAEESCRAAAVSASQTVSPDDSLAIAKAMIADAQALNVRLKIQHENPLVRTLRGLLSRIDTDARRLDMEKHIVRDLESQRDAALRDLASAKLAVRELEASRDQARRAAHYIRERVATITKTTRDLDAFFGSSDTTKNTSQT